MLKIYIHRILIRLLLLPMIILFVVPKFVWTLGRSWRRGTKCGCKIEWLWVRSPLEEVKYLFTFIFSFLRSGVEAKRGVEFHLSTVNTQYLYLGLGGKWETECLNTRFPLPTLLCAGYSMKLIYLIFYLNINRNLLLSNLSSIIDYGIFFSR